jgi:hypothetical protein
MCFYNCGNETPPEVDGDIVITVSDFEKLPWMKGELQSLLIIFAV